jgi:hypothetical protein
MTTTKRRRSISNYDSQNDEAFLKLLSSQRELLQQLNYEGSLRRSGPPKKRFSIVGNGDFAGTFNVLTNSSISDPGNAMDLLTYSKRLSLGVGSDQFILPSFNDLMTDGDEHLKGASSKADKFLDFECDEPVWVKRQRRRSTLGYLRSIFQDDSRLVDSTQPLMQSVFPEETRRESMQPLSKYVDSICNSDPLDHDVMMEPIIELKPSTKIDEGQMKSYMEAFASAMEKSADSQQSIHDWDRKMGLKRSHSKTMRMSSRSRKKLRGIVKKEINALASGSR